MNLMHVSYKLVGKLLAEKEAERFYEIFMKVFNGKKSCALFKLHWLTKKHIQKHHKALKLRILMLIAKKISTATRTK